MDSIIIGVDTHKDTHTAVVINSQGARLGSMTIAATHKEFRDLEGWANAFGTITAFGIEGTGSYGAGLSRELLASGHTVLDVMRPNRQSRYLHGKSDNLDAENAARSVLNGQAMALAKTQAGTSEMIRHFKVARDSAAKSRSQAMVWTSRLEHDPRYWRTAQPFSQSSKSNSRVLEAMRRSVFQSKCVQMGFGNIHANGMICHLRHVLCLSSVDCDTRIRSGPLVKTAVDHTPRRSTKTKRFTIQPPPLPTINGVVGSGSFIPQEPRSA